MIEVYEIDGLVPVVDPTAFVHPSAVLIGDVIIGPGCYVGPAACLRGDFGRLILEEGANLQDTCVMHGFPNTDTLVEKDGHVGHGAVLHGCRVGRNVMVGMNTVVMDNVTIGENSIVAAMAFIKADMTIPPRSLVAGVPARVVRELSDQEIDWKAQGTKTYQQLAVRSLKTMRTRAPLAAIEPDRKRIQVDDLDPLYEARRKFGD
jgi:phenylacetic acid degradation protein